MIALVFAGWYRFAVYESAGSSSTPAKAAGRESSRNAPRTTSMPRSPTGALGFESR
jgi:hypothetical protein